MGEKKEGILMFDIGTGKFWIVDEDNEPITVLEFSDKFEVLFEEKWIETKLLIDSDDNGDLVFKLEGTNLYGVLNGVPARK